MKRWRVALIVLAFAIGFGRSAQAVEGSTKPARPVEAGATLQLEASRGSLYDIPYNVLEVGGGIGFRQHDSPLTFHWLGVLGRGATQNGLAVWTLATTVSVDISYWKLHLEPTAGWGMLTVDRITQSSTLVGFTWPLAIYAGPSFDLGGYRLAIDLALHADLARNASGHGFGMRVRYDLF